MYTVAELSSDLRNVLPEHMLPGNVGKMNEIVWPFWKSVKFEFGVNPSWTVNTRETEGFQIDQEAGFLLSAIHRKAWDSTTAGDRAPLQVEFQDRQSKRLFQNTPMPLQAIGKRDNPLILPVMFLIEPNAHLDVIMSSIDSTIGGTGTQTTVGDGTHELVFFGYRIRMGDMKAVYKAIFG